MDARFGLRSSLAIGLFACALLVACGGGGGGGNITPSGGSTPTPTPAPTIAPTSQATTAAIASTGGTITVGGVSASGINVVSSGSVTLPAFTGAASTNTTVTLQATLPSSATTPQYRAIKGRQSIPYTNINPLVYFILQVSSNITVTQSPGFSVTAPAALSGSYFVAVFDVNNAGNGWNLVAGPVTPVGATVTFPSATIAPFNLVAGDSYVFVIFSATATPTPSPTPTPTTTPTATPTPTPTPAPTGAGLPTAGPTLLPTSAPNHVGWSPSQVAAAFNFPIYNNGASTGWNGQGQTIVVIGDNPPIASDLTTYLSAFGLSSRPAYTTVNVNGSNPTDGGGQFEATLDLQTVEALAPAANIEFYSIADTTGSSFTQAYNKILTDPNHPAVVSISFGGCEGAYDQNTDAPIFAQMAAAGISVFASSGDQGNECYSGPGFVPGVNYPASDPNVTGVGGNETATSLTSNEVWNDNFFATTPPQGASGGGVSTLFTPPPFQIGLSGASSTTWRNVPDITMPSVGVAIYSSGSWGGALGTSWSAPEAAAMTAEIDEYCGGSFVVSLGSSPVARWYTAYSRSAGNFLDITANSTYNANGNQYGSATPVYYPAVGYDNVSGLGAPYGYLVMNSLCPNRTPSARPLRSMAAAAIDQYGEARDTSVGYVPRIGAGNDLGARGSGSVEVTLVMRATQSLASDEQSVLADLRSAGFSITQTYSNHLVIVAQAPASVVGSYFGTSIHNVMQGRFGVRYANVTPVILPASIARVVHGAIVDNMITMRPISEHLR